MHGDPEERIPDDGVTGDSESPILDDHGQEEAAPEEAKQDVDKIDFTAEGETLGYISLDQARVLALRFARENTDAYGTGYAGIDLAWEITNAEDGEDYYQIRISFRPVQDFRGEPGTELFTIDKLGILESRQVLTFPSPKRRLLAGALALGGIVSAVVIVVILFVSGVFSTDLTGQAAGVVETKQVTSQVLIPEESVIITSATGDVKINVPTGAVATSATLYYVPVTPAEMPPLAPGFIATNKVFDIKITDETGSPSEITSPIKISIGLDPAIVSLADKDPSRIEIQHHDGTDWQVLDTEVDLSSLVASAEVTDFSPFALTVQELGSVQVLSGSLGNAPTTTPTPLLPPTPMPTYTPHPTYTPLPMQTYTPYPTYTPWPTPVVIPTFTPVPIPTYTPYPTYTPVPTPVVGPTYTPYPTFTPWPTPTPYPTPMPTYTPWPTTTPTPVPTPTPVATPTAVPTPTPTAIPSMATPTPAPTATPTPAPTATPTPTPTATPTPTPFDSGSVIFGTDDEDGYPGEDGSTFVLWWYLGSQPSSEAVLSLASKDTGEVTLSPATLTFTTSNWNDKQYVTFTGVDDTEQDGNQEVTIIITDNYGRDYPGISVENVDDDSLDWHLERGGDSSNVEISETGSTDTFEMWLWSQPSSDAVLSIVSGDTGEVLVFPTTLTFTNSNWDSAQTVTLIGVNDTDLDGDQTTTVTVSGVGDGWSSIEETVTVVTEDDEVLEWHVNPSDQSSSYLVGVSETGSTSGFGISLKYPGSEGVISIVSNDTGEATVSPGTLTFTNSNWDSMQTVTVTGVDDTDDDGDQTTTITISGVGDDWAGDENLYVVTEDDEPTLPNSLVVAFDSGVEGEAWGNGTFARCDSGAPCGALSSGIFGGREVYVKAHANSDDPTSDWYWAYIFHKWDAESWIIQYVNPALTDSAGNYLWNAHRYSDRENPWGDWGDLTVSQGS